MKFSYLIFNISYDRRLYMLFMSHINDTHFYDSHDNIGYGASDLDKMARNRRKL